MLERGQDGAAQVKSLQPILPPPPTILFAWHCSWFSSHYGTRCHKARVLLYVVLGWVLMCNQLHGSIFLVLLTFRLR